MDRHESGMLLSVWTCWAKSPKGVVHLYSSMLNKSARKPADGAWDDGLQSPLSRALLAGASGANELAEHGVWRMRAAHPARPTRIRSAVPRTETRS